MGYNNGHLFRNPHPPPGPLVPAPLLVVSCGGGVFFVGWLILSPWGCLSLSGAAILERREGEARRGQQKGVGRTDVLLLWDTISKLKTHREREKSPPRSGWLVALHSPVSLSLSLSTCVYYRESTNWTNPI